MKYILLFSILFCVIAMPLYAQSKNDDTLKIDIAVIQTELKNLKAVIDKGFRNVETRFDTVETRLGTVETRLGTVETRLGTVGTRLGTVETRFDGIEKNFDRLNNIIIACIGIPLAILAIGATVWGILGHRRSLSMGVI